MIDDILPVSPIPEDADLTPGRLPFTAFGQFGDGNMDLRVFAQGIYWVDTHGEPFLIQEMPKEHLLRVLRMLMRHAEFFHAHAYEAAMTELQTAALIDGHERARDLENALGARVLDVTADDWLRATPLAQALVARARSL